jgi:methylated-DNA-protein-cysteine methyltransferase-like protein
MSSNTDFFEQVWEVVRQIPPGKVTSYGAIASFLGHPRSARTVGYAMNASHQQNDVPAHRVVNRNGLLSGKMHFSSPTEMEERLLLEGLTIQENQIVDFEKHFWNPEELFK